jgi:DNA-binding MarR family transcriptional regulator
MEDQSEQEIREIIRYFNTIRAEIRRSAQADLASSGLTPQQARVLEELSNEDGLTITQLSQRMELAHSTVSGIVDRLEKKHLLQRRQEPRDRRYARIYLDRKVIEYLNYNLPSSRAGLLVGALRRAAPAKRALILAGMAELRRLIDEERKVAGGLSAVDVDE